MVGYAVTGVIPRFSFSSSTSMRPDGRDWEGSSADAVPDGDIATVRGQAEQLQTMCEGGGTANITIIDRL